MAVENAVAKARRYLVEGRVMIHTVGADGVRAMVRGHGRVYQVAHAGGVWRCDCPARTPRCCHVLAVGTVVTIEREGNE